jgi:hypothetical protein
VSPSLDSTQVGGLGLDPDLDQDLILVCSWFPAPFPDRASHCALHAIVCAGQAAADTGGSTRTWRAILGTPMAGAIARPAFEALGMAEVAGTRGALCLCDAVAS